MYISTACTLLYSRLDIDTLCFKVVASMPLSLEPMWLIGLVSLGDSTIPKNSLLLSKSSSALVLLLVHFKYSHSHLDTDYLDPSRYSTELTSLLSLFKDSSEPAYQQDILALLLHSLCNLRLFLPWSLWVHTNFLTIRDQVFLVILNSWLVLVSLPT